MVKTEPGCSRKMFMPYILLAASVACVWTASADTFDVTKYGADPKGVKKSTDAVHKAIEAAVSAGGGVVHFPAGHYLCGPIELRSHVTLDVADGAVVKFSDDLDDYQPVVEAMADGSRQTSFATKGLISASKLTNIGITGAGVLDGQGSAWWKLVDSPYRAEYLRSMNRTQSANTDTIANRPKFFIATDCKNIVLKDITFKDSPFFHVNVVDCDGVTIEGIKLDSPADSPNTDGIDPDSSKNILISKVTINAGDDCIAIKAGMDDSKERAPTENLIIRDSHMGHGHGGVSIGSDFVGGVRNVTVMDCVFDGPDRGFYIKSARGRGGPVQDIQVKNIKMTNIKKEFIMMDMTYPDNYPKEIKAETFKKTTPVYKDITIDGITGDAKNSISITGLPESHIENVKFMNIEYTSHHDDGGFLQNFTDSITKSNFTYHYKKAMLV